MLSSIWIYENVTYGKSAIRPRNVSFAFVHFPGGGEHLYGTYHQTLTLDDALAVHIKKIRLENDTVCSIFLRQRARARIQKHFCFVL